MIEIFYARHYNFEWINSFSLLMYNAKRTILCEANVDI